MGWGVGEGWVGESWEVRVEIGRLCHLVFVQSYCFVAPLSPGFLAFWHDRIVLSCIRIEPCFFIYNQVLLIHYQVSSSTTIFC